MRACGHRRTLRNHLLRIHISNTLTFAKSRVFFLWLVSRLSSVHHYREDKWLSSLDSRTPFFSGPPILERGRVRTLSSSVPTTRNQNRRSFICTATMSGLFAKSSLFLFGIPSFYGWDQRDMRITRYGFILCVIKKRTQGQRNIHISRLTPPQTYPIYCEVWWYKSSERPQYLPQRCHPYELLPTRNWNQRNIHITRKP